MSRTDDRWQEPLDPFAHLWAEFDRTLEVMVVRLTDDELAELADACTRPTSTNCWYATFHVAPLVAEEVRREQYRRRMRVGTSVAVALMRSWGGTGDGWPTQYRIRKLRRERRLAEAGVS